MNEYILRQTENLIPIFSPAAFEKMRVAGRLAAQTLDHVAPYVKPGVSTEKLDQICHKFIEKNGAISACLGYKGYPKSVCISVNHVVCHGIPSDKKILRDGDILNIDVTVIVGGWYGDTSRMFVAGKADVKSQKLMDVTRESLERAIEFVKPGITFGDIGHLIQTYVEDRGYSTVREFCGHGIGNFFHGPPEVLHFGEAGTRDVVEEGMFFTIEPMINIGRPETKILADGWTAVTRDKTLSAQYEHTLGVTADGCEIFTVSK